jgi:transcriptional regulator GlxA family with amidase domain
MRLHRAMDLLTDNAGTVSEIAYLVGFGNPSHFTKRFQEQFGELPSEVRKKTERHEMPRKPTQSN